MNNRMNERFVFRLTSEERDTIDQLARSLRRSRSDALRLILAQAHQQMPCTDATCAVEAKVGPLQVETSDAER